MSNDPSLDRDRRLYNVLIAAFCALTLVFGAIAIAERDSGREVRTAAGASTDGFTDAGADVGSSLADVSADSESSTLAASGSAAAGRPRAGSATAGGASAAGSTDPGGEIVIGSVVSATGPVSFPEAAATQRAFWAKFNDDGGLNGRKVRLVLYDDGLDANRSYAAFRRLVEQDNVVALVGSLAPLGEPRAIPYLTEKGVPLVPGSGLTGLDSPSTWFLALGPQREGTAYCNEALRQGLKSVYFLYVETDLAHPLLDAFRTCFEKAGAKVVGEEAAQIGQPDYTTTALNVRRTGAEAVYTLLGGPGDILNLWRAMDRQGVTARTLGRQGSDVDALKNYTGPAGAGYTIQATNLPPHAGGAAIEEIRAALAKYVPGTNLQSGNVSGWVAATLFVDCLRRIEGPITRNSILAEMDRTTDFTSKGLIRPLTYRPGRHLGSTAFYWQKQGTEWGPVHSGDI
jgi:branched-chain amino acid transport system substrate-binding protein